MPEGSEEGAGLDDFDRIVASLNEHGVAFDEAWSRKQTSRFGPNEANFIGLGDLIANKERVARPQDLADVQKLSLARNALSQDPKKPRPGDTK